MLKPVDIVIEASRRGEFPRVGTREARRIVQALAEWLEHCEHSRTVGLAAAELLRDSL